MASESHEEGALGPDLPAELRDWLDGHAATLGLDREQLVVQILASYHAAADLDGDVDPADLVDLEATDLVDVEAAVEAATDEYLDTAVQDRLDDLVAERVEAELDERIEAELDGRVATAVDERVEEATEARARAVDDRLDELDDEFQAKIADVRERVVQVKRETDGKAPAKHTHEELERVDDLAASVRDLQSELSRFREEVDGALEEGDDARDAIDERLADAEEKLTRVAWVVSDLKDDVGGRGTHDQAVARIKRAAAQEGVSAATCENCGESVHVALLTDPECPHCRATVSDVRPGGGILRRTARLVAAAQLEAGPDDGDHP